MSKLITRSLFLIVLFLQPTPLVSRPLIKPHRNLTHKSLKKDLSSTTHTTEDMIAGLLVLSAYADAQAGVTEFITQQHILELRRPNNTELGYPTIPLLKTLQNKWHYVRFTDDTHMSLYLLHALFQSTNQSIPDILNIITHNFINWIHSDQKDRAPGQACIANCTTLQNLQKSNILDMSLWSRGLLSSLDITESDQGLRKQIFNKEGGSGAVMRTAPISIFFQHDPIRAEQLSVAQGILTHTDSGSRAACAGFNAAIQAIIQQETIDHIFQAAINAAQKYDDRPYSQPYNPQKYAYGSTHFSQNGCAALCKKAYEYYQQGLLNKPYEQVLDELRGWGATEALAATLYIFATWNNNPYLALSIAINRTPGDSDTIAKMIAELLGLQYGLSNIIQNFNQHGLNLEQEIPYLENIDNLAEYPTHFPEFHKRHIKSFQELAKELTKQLSESKALY